MKRILEGTLFQFTLPCGERRVQEQTICIVESISIHAPVWGATEVACDVFANIHISIHAPVWGATYITLSNDDITIISIHAPVWGAT